MILISLCLCRINKHAEQLSILRGIDVRGPNVGREALGGFIRGAAMGGKKTTKKHSPLSHKW